MGTVLAVVSGYLVGSVPFAFLLARRRGIDLREAGSGNVGAANVLRTSGVVYGIVAVCLDVAKGALAVIVAQTVTDGPAGAVAGGLAAIVGHVHPVWLGFRGGKGVATGAGVFAILSPGPALLALAVFVLGALGTRYVSVGSMAAAVALATATAVGDHPRSVTMGAVAAAVLIVYRHRGNLARLTGGTERRIGQRA